MGDTLERVNPQEARIVFMGTPAFAVPSLRALVEAGYTIACVMSQPDRPSGRGGKMQFGPVKSLAVELELPTFQPEKLRDPGVVDQIAGFEPTAFVVAAYGKIIPNTILSLPSRGSVNVHASLLPRWRGASPIEAAILAGDPESGVSIMEVVQKMDAGAVVSQVRVPIRPNHTGGTLEADLATAGAKLLVETLPGWLERTVSVTPQDDASATYCTLISKEDGALQRNMSVVAAERAVRAFNPWPGAYMGIGEERLTAWEAHVETTIVGAPSPGALLLTRNSLAVGFEDGWLALDVVQRPGGKRQPVREYLNGMRGRGITPDRAVLA